MTLRFLTPPEEVQAGPLGGRVIRPAVSWRRHRLLAAALAIGIWTLGLPLAWIQGTALYQTQAVIHVAPRFAKVLAEDRELELQSNTQYLWFINQQTRSVNRYDIVHEALLRLGPQAALWQREEESLRKAAERLQGALEVRSVRDTYLITVGLTSKDPTGLERIVNTVVETYLEKIKGEEIWASDERLELLEGRRDELEEEIATLERQRLVLADRLGITTFLGENFNPMDTLLIEAQQRLASASQSRLEAQSRLDALIGLQASELLPIDAQAAEQLSKDPGLNSFKANLFKRRSDLLTTRSGLRDEHPRAVAAIRELSEIEAELAAIEQELMDERRVELLTLARGELAEAELNEERLRAQAIELEERANRYAADMHEALAATEALDFARRRLEEVIERIDFLRLESIAPGFVRMVTEARQPIDAVKGGRKQIFLVFVVLGVGAALAVPIAIDLLDRRLHNPLQLAATLGFQPLAWLAERSGPDPTNLYRDQLMRLGMRLMQQLGATQSRAVACTGVRPGGGVTDMVLDLGRLLHDQGYRVLLVEANVFAPDPRFQGPEDTAGLVEWLRDGAELQPVRTPERPDRIPVGDATTEPFLPNTGRLQRLLRELEHSYDLVLIDLPPLVLAGDAEPLIHLADATLLVVEAGEVTIGDVKEATAALARLQPEAVGTVLNRFEIDAGGPSYPRLGEEQRTKSKKRPNLLITPWLWP